MWNGRVFKLNVRKRDASETGSDSKSKRVRSVRMLTAGIAVRGIMDPWLMLINLDAQHPALVGLSWMADLFVVQTCVACSCNGTVYMETDRAGRARLE